MCVVSANDSSALKKTEEQFVGRLLVVDDEPAILSTFRRILNNAGYDVVVAEDGGAAAEALKRESFDAVFSDICMPGTSGIELLRFVRETNPELPVILMTGDPAIETAIQALDHGAFKYLLKPIETPHIVEVARKAVQMATLARLRREALAVTATATGGADPELRATFDEALAGLWMAFQPIVTCDGELYGHEALMRLKHPRVPHPGAMLEAAEKLDDLTTLGRAVRTRSSGPVASEPGSGALFINLHPYDLNDPDLLNPDTPLTRLADRVVLEITERKDLSNMQNLRTRIIQVRELGFRVAIDDLGAGYAGLTSFALLEPDIVKIDMSLVRDIDRSPVKQRLVRSLTALCADMGITVVGEGVETKGERDALVELGCDLLQGYHIAKPGQPFPAFVW